MRSTSMINGHAHETVVVVTIDVLGTPAPKGSGRAVFNKRTGKAVYLPGGSKVNQTKIKSWDVAVRAAALDVLRSPATPVFVNTPLVVEIAFRMARPQGHWGKGRNVGQVVASAPPRPITKPDLDKLIRATLDPLTGLVFDDDSRIVELKATKHWAQPGYEGASITVAEA